MRGPIHLVRPLDLHLTVEILLINHNINLILSWSANFLSSVPAGVTTFATTDIKLYVPALIVTTLCLTV